MTREDLSHALADELGNEHGEVKLAHDSFNHGQPLRSFACRSYVAVAHGSWPIRERK
jgi:hypothetical protein